MTKKDHRQDVFCQTLKLLRLEAKKFDTMLQIVELLAWQHLKEDTHPEQPTIAQHEALFDYIPWTFFPNVDDYGRSSKLLRKKNQIKYEQLKHHLAAIKETLDAAEVLPR